MENNNNQTEENKPTYNFQEVNPQREQFKSFVDSFQEEFISSVQKFETKKKAFYDHWERKDKQGKGLTIVIQDGNFIEKAAVNTTQMEIPLSKQMVQSIIDRKIENFNPEKLEDYNLYANGVSLIIHNWNPFVPTVHANFRYLEVVNNKTREIVDHWLGGGGDLTPVYFFEEDAVLFHQNQKDACDKHDKELYKKLKKECDDYFYIGHRKEHRGVGGTFFDKFTLDNDFAKSLSFAKDIAYGILNAYKVILDKRKDIEFNEKNVEWRKVRRGRYVEFNLVIDRGTKFGFNTPNARIESILCSMPLEVRFEYMYEIEEGSEEDKIQKVITSEPREWV